MYQQEKLTIDDVRKLLKFVYRGYKVPQIVYDVLKRIAIKEVEEGKKVVLVKRDPDIDRDRIQAAFVKITDGEGLGIPPHRVQGFGADFDGDSCKSFISLYLRRRGKWIFKKINIEDFQDHINCKLESEKVKENGKIIKNYKVLDKVYVDAIDKETGNIYKKLITHWSIHENLKMYSINRKPKNTLISDIKDLWISNDHSVIMYSEDDKNIIRCTPNDIIHNSNKKYLIKKIDNSTNSTTHISYVPYSLIKNMSMKERFEKLELTNNHTFRIKKSGFCVKKIIIPEDIIDSSDLSNTCKTLLKMQNKGEIEFIPCEHLDIEYDPNVTVGYDLTVEDYNTFTTGDGIFLWDTMSVFVPLSEEAQMEAMNKMFSPISNNTYNAPNFNISKEMIIGIFILTYLNNKNVPISINSIDVAKTLDVGDIVLYTDKNGRRYETTAGRVIFNSLLPEYVPFINESVNNKKLSSILSSIANRNKQDLINSIDTIMKTGFYYSTLYPQTISINEILNLPDVLIKLKEKLGKEKNVTKQSEIITEMDDELLKFLEKEVPDLYIHIASGATKGIGSLRQIMVSKGLIMNPKGDILKPITTSLSTGFNSKEYFNASPGGRKATIDRALNTASGGYTYRKMIYVLGNLEGNIENPDCGTKRYMNIKLSSELFKKMQGRYVFNDKGQTIPIDSSMIGNFIKLRSPIFCKSNAICRTCYGDLIYQLKSENIGIISAQTVFSFSEDIMKCSCGIISLDDGTLKSFEDIWDELD